MFDPANKFTVSTKIHLSLYDALSLRKFINLHYLGDEDANHLVDGQMVAKYPEKETQEFKDAAARIESGFTVNLKVTFDVNGNASVEIIK
jgi:hypothetical protein